MATRRRFMGLDSDAKRILRKPGGSEDNAYDKPCHTSFLHWVEKRGAMAEQAISCPSCGMKIPLTRALRAEIESSVKEQYEAALERREGELRVAHDLELAR